MELIITLVVIVFGFGIVTGIHAYQKTADVKKVQEVQTMQRLSSNEIQKQLTVLAKRSPPSKLSDIGAMCYKVAAPPDRVEYVCPKDGEKTLYKNTMVHFIMSDLPSIRSYASRMPGVTVTIDESELCKKCSPHNDAPQVHMTVTFADRTHTVDSVTMQDLQLMFEFLSGKDRHLGSYDAETALKDYIPRLEELFGVKIGK